MHRSRPTAITLATLPLLVAALSACGVSGPPRVTNIIPGRDASGVATATVVQIGFDHPMQHASVESRFHLRRLTDSAQEHATSPDELVTATWTDSGVAFAHARLLEADSWYEAFLAGGFADSSGAVNGAAHSWRFHTEGAFQVTGFTPGAGAGEVPLDRDLKVSFNRPVDLASLAASVTVNPPVPLRLVAVADDPRSVILAPRHVLAAAPPYTVTLVSPRDREGNPLASALDWTFTTAAVPDLNRAILFYAAHGNDTGIWMVRQSEGQPRQVYSGPVRAFWWLSGSIAVVDAAGAVTQVGLDGTPIGPISIAPDSVASPDGAHVASIVTVPGAPPGLMETDLASGLTGTPVTDWNGGPPPGGSGPVFSWSADAGRIVYATYAPAGWELWAVDLALGAHYRVASLAEPPSQLSWSPDGTRVAYLGPTTGHVRELVVSPPGTATGERDLGTATEVLGWTVDSAGVYLFDPRLGIRSVPADGSASDVRTIIPASADHRPAGDLAVSADGRQLAFTVSVGSGRQVWLAAADGSDPHPLFAAGNGFDYETSMPRWYPVR
ncbi:MAG: Ig-like domain-containing protein [Candidatus Dormibacteria bacterium]